MSKPSQVLKAAIERSGLSHRSIETSTGVARASIMRFMRGESFLRLDNVDALCDLLGLELRQRKGDK